MSLLEDIGGRLEQQSVGTQGTNIFLNHMPDDPIGAISLIEGLSRRPERTMKGRSVIHHSLRVLARDLDAVNARARIVKVIEALDGYVGTINATRYLFIEANSGPVALGQDERGGQQFYCSFHIQSNAL